MIDKSIWIDKDNLVIKEYLLPSKEYATPWPGALEWAKLCNLAEAGAIPAQTKYEVVQFIGNGIWSIVGSSHDLREAVEIAATASPEPYVKIPSGYMTTSTGELVLADDWDTFEGSL
jgi:hypothetical protein